MGATTFGEKRGGQCQGAGDTEPNGRMETSLEEPPGPRGCCDERKKTEAKLNFRLSSRRLKWPCLEPVSPHGVDHLLQERWAVRRSGRFGVSFPVSSQPGPGRDGRSLTVGPILTTGRGFDV